MKDDLYPGAERSFVSEDRKYQGYQSTAESDLQEVQGEKRRNGNRHPKDIDTADADNLAKKLIACNDNEDLEQLVLKRTLDISYHDDREWKKMNGSGNGITGIDRFPLTLKRSGNNTQSLLSKMITMLAIAILGLVIIFILLEASSMVVGPPSQPVGAYKLKEVHEGDTFFNHYAFYSGKDSAGSKGYVTYVNREKAFDENIANVTYEDVVVDSIFGKDTQESRAGKNKGLPYSSSSDEKKKKEPFVYLSTLATSEGPRDSIRLEGLRRFNRGLFILDVRHIPQGCATWPAFWLSDEPNWPVHGEIDILEGVNEQNVAKTALHTTRGCSMDDVPLGVKTGSWDQATGVPKKNGDIDHTVREARNCFVYDPHQWLNQGCVAQHHDNTTLGSPLNKNGGGVFVLEWDPINHYMKAWAFSPHTKVPDNLRESMETANHDSLSDRVSPDPLQWGLPYAYFPIGRGTNCPSDHFLNMRLIFNTALCGSVAGNRFAGDCPELKKKYGSCENYVNANTLAMDEVYWKVRGVYIYEREWERSWADEN